jgi:hypothetical protein
VERPIEDFLGKEICYKCEYRRKKREIKAQLKCKICGGPLPIGRWSYCSKECAKEAKRKHKYWTTKLVGMYNWNVQTTCFQRKIYRKDDII